MMDLYKIKTTVLEDDMISQETKDLCEKLSVMIVKTKDEHIRESLKKLGWIPPDESIINKKVMSDILSRLLEIIDEPYDKDEKPISLKSTIYLLKYLCKQDLKFRPIITSNSEGLLLASFTEKDIRFLENGEIIEILTNDLENKNENSI